MLPFYKNRILGLDGLRAVAIALVFAEHKTKYQGIGFGSAGVLLFFVLSGYLITGILSRSRSFIEKGESTPKKEIIDFFRNRSFRIFPAYYAMLAILLLISLSMHWRVSIMWALAYVTYTTNIGTAYIEHTWAPLGHLWSLAVEEQFYLLAAPLILLTPVRQGKYAVLGMGAAALVSACVLTLTHAPLNTFATDSFINFGYLGIGSALSLYLGPSQGRRSAPALIGLFMLAIALPAIIPLLPFEFTGQPSIFIAALVVYGVLSNQNSWIVKVLDWGPVRRLGRISYAFYLWHYVISFNFLASSLAAVGLPDWLVSTSIFVLEFAATVAVATMSWWALERPMMQLRDRVAGKTAESSRLSHAG